MKSCMVSREKESKNCKTGKMNGQSLTAAGGANAAAVKNINAKGGPRSGSMRGRFCEMMPDSIDPGRCYIFGGMIMDHYYKITGWPGRGQDGFITGEKMIVGGCAVNMAVTLKNLGADSCVISGMGSDSEAESILKYMEANGLSSEFLIKSGRKTGKCLVFLEPDGERTFLTEKGAEGVFSGELDRKIRAQVPAVAGVTGYYLLDNDAGRIMDCIEYIHGKGTKILFDPSPLVSSIDESLLARIIAVSEIITPNRTELEVIQRITSLEDYCRQGKTAVVKSGGDGGTVYFGWRTEEADALDPEGKMQENLRFINSVQENRADDGNGADNTGNDFSDKKRKTGSEVIRFDSVQIESFDYQAACCHAVDTTGAGDSFAGALLYAMLKNMPIDEAVFLASRCAAKTVEIEGPHGFWSLED